MRNKEEVGVKTSANLVRFPRVMDAFNSIARTGVNYTRILCPVQGVMKLGKHLPVG
jgi:hypothetical protein